MNVYDTITADTLEGGEQILITRPFKRGQVRIPLENVKILVSEGDSILVSGYNHNTGENSVFGLWADEDVELWSV